MKKILIDIYKIKDLYSGLGQFSMNFAEEIIHELSDDYQIHFLTPKNQCSLGNNAIIIKDNIINRHLSNTNKGYDIWHSLQQFPSHLPHKKTPQILTIHDLNFLEEKGKKKAKKYLKILQRNVDKAHTLTCISSFTKKILLQHINTGSKPIYIIHNGVKLNHYKSHQKPNIPIKDKFLFSISVFKKKKNFEAIVSMMEHLPEYQLIIAGNHETKYGEKIKELIKKLGLEQQIILIGKISDEDKYWYYKNCEAFLFPSKAEGFGMPVIEAMSLGKPVFLSRWSSLPEVGGDLAYYFDYFEPFHMANIVKTELNNYPSNRDHNSLKIQKHAQQFNWKNCIREYIKVYELIG
ncbi:MAG: glycosyltransferase involved in cell wall biosynthesis [Maribacter sp.]|jgi:glycosyltransferase involved in cell wall biosynthesis